MFQIGTRENKNNFSPTFSQLKKKVDLQTWCHNCFCFPFSFFGNKSISIFSLLNFKQIMPAFWRKNRKKSSFLYIIKNKYFFLYNKIWKITLIISSLKKNLKKSTKEINNNIYVYLYVRKNKETTLTISFEKRKQTKI